MRIRSDLFVALVLSASCLSTGGVAASTETVLANAGSPQASPLMRVHFIDVGQGDATLLEFPCGAVLVDTGGEYSSSFNSKDELEAYLDSFFARRQDLGGRLTSLVLTHPHIDHTRGVRLVRDYFEPWNVVTNGQSSGSGGAQQKMITRYAADHEDGEEPVGFWAVRLEDIDASTGLTNSAIDPVSCGGCDPQITALWGQVDSDPGWGSHYGKPRFNNSNNHSVVLRVDFGGASVLLTGDLEEVAIEDLVELYHGTDLLDVDVYQLGHHGSLNGTTDSLIEAMTPDLAVCSMGPASREDDWTAWQYGHPRREVIDMLQESLDATRPAIWVEVGKKGYSFEDDEITQAIYATAWDGTVVLEAGLDGVFRVASPGGSDLININSATLEELDSLPGIGPVKAQRIIEARPFDSVDDLTRVNGIGPATLEGVRNLVEV